MTAADAAARQDRWSDPAAQAREDFYRRFDASGLRLDARGERALAELFQKTVVYAIYRHGKPWSESREFVLSCLDAVIERARKLAGSDDVPAEVLTAAGESVIAEWQEKYCPNEKEGEVMPRGIFCDLLVAS